VSGESSREEMPTSRGNFLKSSALTLAAAGVTGITAAGAQAQQPYGASTVGASRRSALRELGRFCENRQSEQPPHTALGHVRCGEPTMIFGTPTQLENDPRSEIRAFWEHMPPPGGPLG
jgi:hypothetical protein